MEYEERRRNVEEAKAKYREAWWESDNPETLFLGQIQEEVLILGFNELRSATKKVLGRPVYTHEFAEPEELLDEFYKERSKATLEDVQDKLERYGIRAFVVRT